MAQIMTLAINVLKLFMYAIQNYCMHEKHEKFKIISEQFKSIYKKCDNLARVIIRATTLKTCLYKPILNSFFRPKWTIYKHESDKNKK